MCVFEISEVYHDLRTLLLSTNVSFSYQSLPEGFFYCRLSLWMDQLNNPLNFVKDTIFVDRLVTVSQSSLPIGNRKLLFKCFVLLYIDSNSTTLNQEHTLLRY